MDSGFGSFLIRDRWSSSSTQAHDFQKLSSFCSSGIVQNAFDANSSPFFLPCLADDHRLSFCADIFLVEICGLLRSATIVHQELGMGRLRESWPEVMRQNLDSPLIPRAYFQIAARKTNYNVASLQLTGISRDGDFLSERTPCSIRTQGLKWILQNLCTWINWIELPMGRIRDSGLERPGQIQGTFFLGSLGDWSLTHEEHCSDTWIIGGNRDLENDDDQYNLSIIHCSKAGGIHPTQRVLGATRAHVLLSSLVAPRTSSSFDLRECTKTIR